MSTFRLGSTTGPCKISSERLQSHITGENDDRDDCDPDKLLQCPFDKNHQIRACRFPYHLIKCRKNHPQLASELKTCPFNARHLIPKHELTLHTATCVDRRSVSTQDSGETEGRYKWQVPVSTWTNPNTTEDWDEEADHTAAPFVWGESTSLNLKMEASTTNNLTPSVRVPHTLPWSVCRP
ncbi:gametocyte-specific factor 1 [Myripristis murdjan]|uniref:CHHC U11-48K-type domain-containing protein n=1 Tax=Myripristis murdjan TaxID=586833 RepID=A0A667YM53_9TELE|nr:gametocyte-specific factor 1-like [Myripristis murdjan]